MFAWTCMRFQGIRITKELQLVALYQNNTKAYWSGYKYVNLGGTESRYLYKYHSKCYFSNKVENNFEIRRNYKANIRN